MQPARKDLPVTPGATFRDIVQFMQPIYTYRLITGIAGSPLQLTVDHGLQADNWPVWVRQVTGLPELNRIPPQHRPHNARVIDENTLEINQLSTLGKTPEGGELAYLLPVDLTGTQVDMVISRRGQELLTLSLGNGLEIVGPGSVSREITPEQTALLAEPVEYWLQVTYSDGSVIRHQEGHFLGRKFIGPTETQVVVQGYQGPAGPGSTGPIDDTLVLAAALGPFTSAITGPVLEGDSVQLALEKLQRQIDALGTIPLPPTISISPIGGDGDLTALEAASVTIAGVTSAANGAVVAVSLGGTPLGTATVSVGAWSLAGLDLTAYADAVSRTVSAVVGGVIATAALVVRAPIPVPPTISISPIGGDNDITAVEAASVTISGITSAANGATVAVAIGGAALGSTVVAAGAWSLAGVNLSAYADGASHEVTAVVGGVTASTAVTIRAAGPVLPPPVPGIARLAVVGTSLEYGIVNNHATTMKNYLASKHGLNIDVTNYGYTGATIETIASNWNSTIKPALAGRTDTVVMVNALPNTITNLVPYASADPTVLADRKAKWDALVADMRATVGASRVLVMGNMFRDFPPANSCVTNEEIGVVPFDRNWIWPQATIDGRMWLGEAWGAPYNFGYNWTTQVQYDGTHYTVLGYGMLCLYYCDSVASFIKGTAPPRIAKKANPITDTKPRSRRVMIDYSNNANIERSLFLGATLRGSTYTAAIPHLSPHDTYEPALGLAARPLLQSGSQTTLGTGDTSRSITNDLLRTGYQFTTSLTWVLMDTIINLEPNQVVDLEIMVGRATTGVLMAEFSFDQVAIAGEVDTVCLVGDVPRTLKLVGTANSAGELSIWFRRKTGQNNLAAYILAMDVWPR